MTETVFTKIKKNLDMTDKDISTIMSCIRTIEELLHKHEVPPSSIDMYVDSLISQLATLEPHWSSTGDFGIYDERGHVIKDDEGNYLLDINNQPIEYEDDGTLLSTVNPQVQSFIQSRSLITN